MVLYILNVSPHLPISQGFFAEEVPPENFQNKKDGGYRL